MRNRPRDLLVASGLSCAVSAQAFLVTTQAALLSLDTRVVEHYALTRTAALTDFFAYVTILGKASLVAAITFAGAYALHRYFKKEHLALGLFISVGGAALTELILKDLIARARPWDFSVVHELSFSFPSGHASVAMALYGFLAYALWHAPFAKPVRIALASALVALALAVGFSRIYLGVHYPTDVLAGLFVGMVWVILGIHAAHLHEAHVRPR